MPVELCGYLSFRLRRYVRILKVGLYHSVIQALRDYPFTRVCIKRSPLELSSGLVETLGLVEPCGPDVLTHDCRVFMAKESRQRVLHHGKHVSYSDMRVDAHRYKHAVLLIPAEAFDQAEPVSGPALSEHLVV